MCTVVTSVISYDHSSDSLTQHLYRSFYLLSSHLVLFHLSWHHFTELSSSECTVKWLSLLRLQPVRQDIVTYFVLTLTVHMEWLVCCVSLYVCLSVDSNFQKIFVGYVYKYAVFGIKPTYNHYIFIPESQSHSPKILFGEGGSRER